MLRATFRTLIIAAVCLAVVLVVVPNANAQRFDRGTKITINQPFQIPGTALPAGTYMFRIMDIPGNRNVVQILNADETHTYAIVLGLPDFRLKPNDDTEISFYEAQPGVPLPLHAWFYPGYNSGVEFVYPKAKALEIARASGEPVLATPWEPEYIPEPGELATEPLVTIEPTGEEIEVAAVPEEPVQPAPAEAEAGALPRTASPFPLIALTGFLAAGAAGGLRFVRKWRS
jgi:hypothetical protein